MAKNTYIGVNNVSRQAKKIYVGINGVARQVKKIYIGIANIAREIFGGRGTFAYYKYLTSNYTSSESQGVSNNNYAIIGLGRNSTGSSIYNYAECYNQFLTKTTKGINRYLNSATCHFDKYAIFRGGCQSNGTVVNNMYCLDDTLTLKAITGIGAISQQGCGSATDEYAIFGGGIDNNIDRVMNLSVFSKDFVYSSYYSGIGRISGRGGNFNNKAYRVGGGTTDVEYTDNTLTTSHFQLPLTIGQYCGALVLDKYLITSRGGNGKEVYAINEDNTFQLIDSLTDYHFYGGDAYGVVDNHAIFFPQNGNYLHEVYDTDLVKTLYDTNDRTKPLSRSLQGIATIGNYLIMSNGTVSSTSKATNAVDVYRVS